MWCLLRAGEGQSRQTGVRLQAKDFIIEDDGVEQKVSMDEAEPQEAVSLVIAIQSGRYCAL